MNTPPTSAVHGRDPAPFKSVAYAGHAPGPRLIVTGAVHGNETCGTRAIERVIAAIDAGEIRLNAGAVTFVPVANPLAYAKGERAGDRNLNRNLAPTDTPRDFEDHVANWLCPLLGRHDVLLDLHSTRARTKPFALVGPPDNDGPLQPFAHAREERAMARVLGVDRFVEGWLATYEKGVRRRVAAGLGDELNRDPRYGVGTTEYMRSQGGYAVTLECGQHADPEAPGVAFRAIGRVMALLGLVRGEVPAPVERYETLRLHEVFDKADPADRFVREWATFDRLAKGELVGVRADGAEVRAPGAGWILFPDAGAQPGHEWFYLAEPTAGL